MLDINLMRQKQDNFMNNNSDTKEYILRQAPTEENRYRRGIAYNAI